MANESLQSLDPNAFQALVQQEVSQLASTWAEAGLNDEEIQEHYDKLFEMGGVACQLIIQEEGIHVEGANQPIPYSPEMAQRLVHYFLIGMNAAVMKAFEQKIPSQEKWELVQQSAIHVFEQGKQAIIATLGQEHTPDVQISDDQIYSWLCQTAVEALLYYINEHEKIHGPLSQPVDSGFPEVAEEMPAQEIPEEEMVPVAAEVQEPVPAQEEPAEIQPQAEPAQEPLQPAAAASVGPNDLYYKYAAIGLISSTMSAPQQTRLLASFDSDALSLIQRYQDPAQLIHEQFDLKRVAHYVRSFKTKLGQLYDIPKEGKEPTYASTLPIIIQRLPDERLERLFDSERHQLKDYVSQYTQTAGADADRDVQLASGVEESLYFYLKRNFPDVWEQMSKEQATLPADDTEPDAIHTDSANLEHAG